MSLPSLQVGWQKVSSAATERWLRIDTTGFVKPVNGEAIHYTPLPYIMVSRLLRMLELRPDDVFVDVGSGKGRVVCCAARWPMRKVVGIELNAALVEIARANAARLRGRETTIEIVHTSAEEFDFNEATVVYLYNPFTERLTTRVLELVYESYQRRPRPLRLAYANPVHESAFRQFDWLEKFAEWPASEYPGFGYPVSFWRTRNVSLPAVPSALPG